MTVCTSSFHHQTCLSTKFLPGFVTPSTVWAWARIWSVSCWYRTGAGWSRSASMLFSWASRRTFDLSMSHHLIFSITVFRTCRLWPVSSLMSITSSRCCGATCLMEWPWRWPLAEGPNAGRPGSRLGSFEGRYRRWSGASLSSWSTCWPGLALANDPILSIAILYCVPFNTRLFDDIIVV